MYITDQQLIELRALLEPEGPAAILAGADYIMKNLTKKREETYELSVELANHLILRYVRWLLDKGCYAEAATILWGPELFQSSARSVRLMWDEIPANAELGIMGAGSMGKSYSVGVWLLLDWIRDPEMTCIKVLSVTAEHAKRNVFAHIKNLHRLAAIQLPGDVQAKSIQANDDEKQGIHLTQIPAGEEGKGRLRGFHPVPRGTPHPIFGKLSRIRLILDEAEEIPQGVWEDVKNVLGNKEGVETVKVIAASNPKDINSKFGQYCEPEDGWDSVNMDDSEKWKAKLGWQIVRIDGAKCENVVHKRIIYPGLLTHEGYQIYLKLPEGSPEYFTMARGWFPTKGLVARAFPMDLVSRLKGEFIFEAETAFCASVDLAFEGDDTVQLAVGRCGMARGWTPSGKPSIIFSKPKFCLQIEQILPLVKMRSLEMAQELKRMCKMIEVKPQWFICDRTGNGTGVHDILCTIFGPEAMGLHYGDGATETKILEDETEKACDHYDGVVTEVFFAMRKWAEFDYVKIKPSICTPEIIHQLTDRRYKQGKLKKVRIESKRDYKDRGNRSPDEIDAITMLLHLVRMRADMGATMMDESMEVASISRRETGYVDGLSFIDPNEN